MPNNFKTDFVKTFNSLRRKHHKYDVFKDFVFMSFVSIHNSLGKKSDLAISLEKEYISTIEKYADEENVRRQLTWPVV